MSHKDWKGPGWYDKFDTHNGEYDVLLESKFHTSNLFHENFRYTQRSVPKTPEKELSDGLYTAIDSEECPITVFRKNNRWYSPYGNQCEDGYVEKVIGRIPVEPVEGS